LLTGPNDYILNIQGFPGGPIPEEIEITLNILDNSSNIVKTYNLKQLDLTITFVTVYTLKQLADGEGSFDDINFFNLIIDEEYGGLFNGVSKLTLVNTSTPITINFNKEPEPECKNPLLGLGILALIYSFLKYSKKD